MDSIIISKEETQTLPHQTLTSPQIDIGKQEVTWWNVIQLSKDYVKEQSQKTGNKQLVYSPHPAERYASSKYMDLGQTAEDAFALLQKLVHIKKSKMGESKYWKDCAINLMDAFSYQAKINNAYNQLKDHEKIPPPHGTVVTVPTVPTAPIDDQPRTYIDFLRWVESDTRIEKDVVYYYKSLKIIAESDYTIVFDDILTHRKKMVELFCKKTIISQKEVFE